MLPRLQARESLRRAAEASVPHIKPESARSVLRTWRRDAEADEPVRKATEADLADLPIRVEHVPAKES